jgi:hypothetical protein
MAALHPRHCEHDDARDHNGEDDLKPRSLRMFIRHRARFSTTRFPDRVRSRYLPIRFSVPLSI